MKTKLEVKSKDNGEVKPAPLLLTREQAAEILNVSGITIHRLIQRKKLRRVDGLRKILIPLTELQRFATVAQ